MAYIFNLIKDMKSPELHDVLQPNNISDLLKRFLSTNGYDPDFISAKKIDKTGKKTEEPLKVKVQNAKLLSCYIDNIAILLYHYINSNMPKKIRIVDAKKIGIEESYTVEDLKKIQESTKPPEVKKIESMIAKRPDFTAVVDAITLYNNNKTDDLYKTAKENQINIYIEPLLNTYKKYKELEYNYNNSGIFFGISTSKKDELSKQVQLEKHKYDILYLEYKNQLNNSQKNLDIAKTMKKVLNQEKFNNQITAFEEINKEIEINIGIIDNKYPPVTSS
jgi:hypothetical protein